MGHHDRSLFCPIRPHLNDNLVQTQCHKRRCTGTKTSTTPLEIWLQEANKSFGQKSDSSEVNDENIGCDEMIWNVGVVSYCQVSILGGRISSLPYWQSKEAGTAWSFSFNEANNISTLCI